VRSNLSVWKITGFGSAIVALSGQVGPTPELSCEAPRAGFVSFNSLFAGVAIPPHKQSLATSVATHGRAWTGHSQVKHQRSSPLAPANRLAATASLKSDANELSNPFRANASLKSEASGLSQPRPRRTDHQLPETLMGCEFPR
jgi:hypothetical protein